MVTRIPAPYLSGSLQSPSRPLFGMSHHFPPLATSLLHGDHSVRAAQYRGPWEPGLHAAERGFEVIISR